LSGWDPDPPNRERNWVGIALWIVLALLVAGVVRVISQPISTTP
jgi:hypothetical protein